MKKSKFLLGAGLGLGLGILLAPKSGKETQKELKVKCDDLLNKIKKIDVEEVKENITEKLLELQNEFKDLNKEKALTIAKEKGNKVLKKADELVKLAIEKGTPSVEKAAKEVKTATAKALKEITKKLEEEKPKKTSTKKASK